MIHQIIGRYRFYHVIFINDMPLHLDKDTDLYVGDTFNHTAGKTTEEIEPKLQVSTCDFNTWCTDNKLGVFLYQVNSDWCDFLYDYFSQCYSTKTLRYIPAKKNRRLIR